MKELLRARDVAGRLGVSESRVYQMITKGMIPSVRYGKAVRVPRAAFERWLEEQADIAWGNLSGLRLDGD